jgi:putative effector of murein hydrolase
VTELTDIWAYLSSTPLLWLTATLAAYSIGHACFVRSGARPWVNSVLQATDTPYETYFEGAQFVHFLLGPATVALAAPLYANRALVRRSLLPLVSALVVGSLTAALVGVGVGMAFGVEREVLISLTVKAATNPVAMGVTEALGGSPTLTAVLVITTGVIGAIIATPLLNALKIIDWRARGLSVGVAAHGIGTARAFQVSQTAGAFAGVGMGLNGLVTALLAPLIASLLL